MRFLLLSILVYSQALVFGQNKVSGLVLDEGNQVLIGATIVLLDQDSTMVAFSLTNQEGRYSMSDMENGEYIIQATFLSYSNYSQPITIEGDIENTPIQLVPSTEVLQEVTIKAEHIPMGIKGDTISYNAAAFKTQANATVEDLLKKLPGIEVDRNGGIKAQGEDVENVLVDGKEFFGSDPKMATKNLTAEAIDKVEVYDKKSDIAEFTGVDDGQDEKTINLKLKEDHKKGGFGTAQAAGGTEDSYEGRLNYFRFTPSLQASVILSANNLNKETFTINDRIDFMGGMMEAMAGGVLNLSQGSRMQDGLNESLSAGANFNYDFSPKLDFRSHYVLNRTANVLQKSINTISFSDDFDFGNTSNIQSSLENLNHQINTKLTYKVNPLLQVILKNNYSWSDQATNRNVMSRFTRNGADQGFSESTLASSTQDWGFDSNTLIKKKFKKKGRNIISAFTLKKSNDLAYELVNNFNRVSDNSFDINQQQDFSNSIQQFSGSVNYMEPLSKKYFLGISYDYGNSQENPFRTYDEFRIDYQKIYQYNIVGISLKRNTKDLKVTLGLKTQLTSLKGIIDNGNEEVSGFFRQLLPSFAIDRELKGGQSLNLNMVSSVNVPELEQLLPFPDNRSPNYQYIGNPALIPAFEQRFNTSYSYFDNFSFTSFWLRFDFTYTQDRIINKTTIADNLFRTLQPVNTDQYYSVGGYASFSRPFKPLKINYKLRTRIQYAQYESFINERSSPVSDNNINFRFSIDNRKTKYVSVESGINLDFYGKKYGLAPDFNQNYFNTDYFVDVEFYLPKAWVISSEINHQNFSQESFSENTSFTLWSAGISKYFFENKLEVKLQAFDLLNQNIGFRRLGSENSLREEDFNNLSRYFMIGMTYKIGSGKKDGIQVQFD
jgi:hypothetical protein